MTPADFAPDVWLCAREIADWGRADTVDGEGVRIVLLSGREIVIDGEALRKLASMAPSERRGHVQRPFAKRFWEKVDRGGGQEACWPWIGMRDSKGYGVLKLTGGRERIFAHRAALILTTPGMLDSELFVCHHCDNPPCCNPAHLYFGTPADNVADRDARGRTARGERSGARLHPESRSRGESHWYSKLTEGDVRSIREARAAGVKATVLAKTFGVVPQLISQIALNQAWKHVK